MTIGDKIRLLRVLNGDNQSDLGNAIDLPQRTIAMHESGRFKPRLTVLESLAYFFNCSIAWLSDESSQAFIDAYYISLPPESFAKKDISTLRRKYNEMDEVLKTSFPLFLQENNVTTYSVCTADNNGKVYIFYLEGKALLFIKAARKFIRAIEYSIENIKLSKLYEANITYEQYNVLFSGNSSYSAESLRVISRAMNIENVESIIEIFNTIYTKRTKRPKWTHAIFFTISNSSGLTEEESRLALTEIEHRLNSKNEKTKIHFSASRETSQQTEFE